MFWSGSKIRHRPFHGAAVDMLRRQVHLGLMRPDERLPPERQFAQDLGIARVTLREALSVLEDFGYFTTRRGSTGGTFVVSEDQINILARRHVTSDAARLWRCLEFFSVNLVEASRHACPRRSPSDLAALRRHAKSIASARHGFELREVHSLLCLAIGQTSGNMYFAEAVDTAAQGLFHPIDDQQVKECRDDFVGTAAGIVSGIETRAAEAAAEATKAYIHVLTRTLREALVRAVASPVD